jgi:hypothetical protein
MRTLHHDQLLLSVGFADGFFICMSIVSGLVNGRCNMLGQGSLGAFCGSKNVTSLSYGLVS